MKIYAISEELWLSSSKVSKQLWCTFLTMHLCIRIMGIGAVSFDRLFAFNLAQHQGVQCSLWQHIFSTTYASNDFWVIYELQMLQNGHKQTQQEGFIDGLWWVADRTYCSHYWPFFKAKVGHIPFYKHAHCTLWKQKRKSTGIHGFIMTDRERVFNSGYLAHRIL